MISLAIIDQLPDTMIEQLRNLLARVVQGREAHEDGDVHYVAAILERLELDATALLAEIEEQDAT